MSYKGLLSPTLVCLRPTIGVRHPYRAMPDARGGKASKVCMAILEAYRVPGTYWYTTVEHARLYTQWAAHTKIMMGLKLFRPFIGLGRQRRLDGDNVGDGEKQGVLKGRYSSL